MKVDNKDMLLYLVTDRTNLKNETLPKAVEIAIKNGVTFVQLREKNADYNTFKNLAVDVKKVTDKYEIPFVINDNVKIAMEVNADGIHIGQSDLNISNARNLVGNDKIIGVSAGNVNEAVDAEILGADYIGVGAIFPTKSKSDAVNVGIDELNKITKAVSIPVVAIGGINEYNIHHLKESKISGVAVISSILAKKDISKATRQLFKLSNNYIYNRR